MVDEYEASIQVEVDGETGVEQAKGDVEVVLNVPVDVTGYAGEGVTDTDIEKAAIEAIQEGKAQVVEVRPTIR